MGRILLGLLVVLWAGAEVLDFDLIKMPSASKTPPRVLILSGIQGDEPGGFNATNLFLRHYKILEGEVWVVPNLNKHSILQNHRGIYGDMNRKFQSLDPKDKEYALIQKIKSLVLDPSIQVIYHLHDGGGFYRANYQSPILNPSRWGNCSIIDQRSVHGSYYENLFLLSSKIVEHINQNTLKSLHTYHIRNTHTAQGDKEMEKSLTYFAITHQKTALANEASKELSLSQRIYYHLLGIEGLLKELGVKFERDFALTPTAIASLLYPPSSYVLINDKIKLPLFGLRKELRFFPFPKSQKLSLDSDQFILGALHRDEKVIFKYGNRVVTSLSPLYLPFVGGLDEVEFEVDGERRGVRMGEILRVKDRFSVRLGNENQRVNIIGYHGKKKDERGELVRLKNLNPKFSIDKRARKYRVEFYREDEGFLGMVIVDFQQ